MYGPNNPWISTKPPGAFDLQAAHIGTYACSGGRFVG
jgi:hypothetical protein